MMLWYTARGAGLAALVLLTLSTALGALVSRQPADARLSRSAPRYLAQYLHRVLAALGLIVLLVHVGTLVADSYAHVGLTGALIPFASEYRPTWVSLGVLAGYLFLAVGVLGAARGAMAATVRGARIWRALHCLAYAGWLSAVLHGFTAGSDSHLGWVRGIYISCVAVVVGAVAVRVTSTLSHEAKGATSRFGTAGRATRPTPLGAPR